MRRVLIPKNEYVLSALSGDGCCMEVSTHGVYAEGQIFNEFRIERIFIHPESSCAWMLLSDELNNLYETGIEYDSMAHTTSLVDYNLRIDIETYCDLDLKKVGVYKYVEHPSFEILMIAYKVNLGPTSIIDIKGYEGDAFDFELEMATFKDLLVDTNYTKKAFNANFERTCLAKWFGIPMPPRDWRCTMVHSYTLGLPGSLKGVGVALNLSADKAKSAEGKALINYFCKPCKATKTNGKRVRNLPEHDREKWNKFLAYCIQDVEAEKAVEDILSAFPVTEKEHEYWCLDQRINDRGIRLDKTLYTQAIELDTSYKKTLMAKARDLTGVTNPGSDAQLKKWITENTNIDAFAMGLTKDTVPKMLEIATDPRLKEILEIRQELNKTSNSKYYAMERCICEDETAKGMLQFYGARTGRWGGRLIQLHNLPQNKLNDLDLARELLRSGEHEAFEMLYGDIPGTLSQLIRTTFIPKHDNHKFFVADFSAIEAVVIAWLAGETWRMDVFRSHGRIYEASASQMFKVPIEEISKDGSRYDLRAKGKIAELALGYGGSVGALKAMKALEMGLEEKELKPLVNVWRKSNKAIVALWWAVGDAAMDAVKSPGVIYRTHGLEFVVESQYLFIKLPSGRRLAYVRPYVKDGSYNKEQLMFEGMDQTKNLWTHIDTYGPKLVENIVQAIARDCLVESMARLADNFYNIELHVHDEIIIDDLSGENDENALNTIIEIMSVRPEWAQDLPLSAAGFVSEFYKKD